MKFTASVKRKLGELFRDKDGLCVLQLENIDFELILNKPYTNSFQAGKILKVFCCDTKMNLFLRVEQVIKLLFMPA